MRIAGGISISGLKTRPGFSAMTYLEKALKLKG
jgi:hypothetical protein